MLLKIKYVNIFMTSVSKIKHTQKPDCSEEIDELDSMQIENFCSSKDIIKKLMVQATEGEEMFVIPVIRQRTQIQNI